MRKPVVAGNWKMNGSAESVEVLLTAICAELVTPGPEVIVLAPFPYLDKVSSKLQGSAIRWGAQNLSQFEEGAYTGEVSASMLADFGCAYVIVGHSERRGLFGDTDELVAEKFCAAQQGGLIPILCVGETQVEREQGRTLEVVKKQLMAVVDKAGIGALTGSILAYEPVWAIGTGLTATPDQAQEVHQALRQHLVGLDAEIAANLRILYGGSVKAVSAGELFQCADIDGGLIGGASLDPVEFVAICRAAE